MDYGMTHSIKAEYSCACCSHLQVFKQLLASDLRNRQATCGSSYSWKFWSLDWQKIHILDKIWCIQSRSCFIMTALSKTWLGCRLSSRTTCLDLMLSTAGNPIHIPRVYGTSWKLVSQQLKQPTLILRLIIHSAAYYKPTMWSSPASWLTILCRANRRQHDGRQDKKRAEALSSG